ncbi:DNA binding protein [Aureococcus anophagefferens]|uniref:DNA binding protein n=1 Tax=Aureococcus anophagefferens TaxID=44056 RepID=A0ABR1GFA7_AURAN
MHQLDVYKLQLGSDWVSSDIDVYNDFDAFAPDALLGRRDRAGRRRRDRAGGRPAPAPPTPDDGDDLLAPCADDCALPARHPRAPPRPMEAYAIFLKTAYAWTSERLKKGGKRRPRRPRGHRRARWASLPPSELAA